MASSDDLSPAAAEELAAKVAALRQPASYPETTRVVEAIETHMSWVFLTETFAYKLKKPVRLPFLDFSTVERRRHFCEEEVRLNRRLSAGIYLGTLPLTRDKGGTIAVGGTGPAIDWLVRMRRLAADRMLDRAIRTGAVTADDIRRLALRLAAFYRQAPPVALSAAEYRRRFEADIAANRMELEDSGGVLPRERVGRVHAAQHGFLHAAAAVFDRRVAEGRIIEAHGDLRPEHVLLGTEPQIIDCLEFNPAFRTLDPADELAFLAMECEMLGAPSIGEAVLQHYADASGDHPPPPLFDFYRGYRACLRAKIAIWHIRAPDPRDPRRWPALAERYLALAERYADALPAAG